ncbi:MAG TPA: hypothetical protein PKN59_07475 [Syntrophales bacterium]|nr:hypothetical protein [Syntrophales bacterium]
MRRSVIWIALLCLIFLAGCAGELAFVKGNKIYKIKDDGDDLAPIAMAAGNYYFRPDVSNDGRDLVFVSAPPTAPGIQVGTICRSKLDGSGFTVLNPSGPPGTTPRWSPNGQFVAYYAAGGLNRAIYQMTAGGINPVLIPNTGVSCDGGHDYFAGGGRIVYAKEMTDGSYKLFWTSVTAAAPSGAINPYLPAAVVTQDLNETLPVVSFAGDMLASALRYPGLVGIRMRAMGTDGNWGPPYTMKLPVAVITGVGYSDKDEKVYFSALPQAGQPQGLYSVSIKELLPTITGLLTLPPGTPPPAPVPVTPARINAGAGENFWPSGIPKP